MSTNSIQEYKKRLPDGYEEEYEYLVGQGLSPSGVAATYTYINRMIEGDHSTREEVAEEFGICAATITRIRKRTDKAHDVVVGHIDG